MFNKSKNQTAEVGKTTTMTDAFVIAPGVRETASEDGAVLLDIEQGICFSLNPVGLRIWKLLKANNSIEQIAADLASDFHVPRPQLLADTTEFIRALQSKRLLISQEAALQTKSWFSKIL